MYRNKHFKSLSRAGFLLALLSLIAIFIASCGCAEIFDGKVPDKAELYENVHSDTSSKDSVMRHLYEWGFPRFNTNKFSQVEALINGYYYEELPERLTLATACADKFIAYFYDKTDLSDSAAVTDALLKCYMSSIGDRYAVYRVPAEQEEFSESISGGKNFVGIGVQIRKTDDGLLYVNTVYKNSGAEAAGVHPCDIITAVGGANVTEIGYDAATEALRGEAGTTVELTVLRGGEELDLTAERKALAELSVTYSFDAETKIAYVSIMTFTKKTGEEFKAAIDELKALGMRGVVFDLRSNLGGVLTAVKECVSYLVEDGLPFISYNKYNTEKTVERTLEDGHKLDVPMVVLANEYTASAAEIFTASLRDYRDVASLGSSLKNVTIVGKNTFGKGVMQSSYSFKDGTSVTFTSYYYNPPSGVNYHGKGIAPDEGYEVEWSLTKENGDAQLRRAYAALEEYFAEAAA